MHLESYTVRSKEFNDLTCKSFENLWENNHAG